MHLIDSLNENVDEEISVIEHSKYYEDNEFIEIASATPRKLSIINLNCQSLNAKFDELQVFISNICSNSTIDVITLQETWFDDKTNLSLLLDCNLNFKSHLKTIGTKISRVIGLLHKLKYIFPAYLLRMIYNSLILPHINYCLLACCSNCHSVELLQKKTVRVLNFKSPVAHTEPILKNMNQLKLPDLYTFHLLKLYYKLYRNKLPPYFENFISQYGAYHQNLRNNHIRLPAIKDASLKKITLNIKCTSDCASWLLHPIRLYIQTLI